jgi:hypothetical protein
MILKRAKQQLPLIGNEDMYTAKLRVAANFLQNAEYNIDESITVTL